MVIWAENKWNILFPESLGGSTERLRRLRGTSYALQMSDASVFQCEKKIAFESNQSGSSSMFQLSMHTSFGSAWRSPLFRGGRSRNSGSTLGEEVQIVEKKR